MEVVGVVEAWCDGLCSWWRLVLVFGRLMVVLLFFFLLVRLGGLGRVEKKNKKKYSPVQMRSTGCGRRWNQTHTFLLDPRLFFVVCHTHYSINHGHLLTK